MKGFYTTDWAVYQYELPPSNLSASAAPFSVNRSSPIDPFMDDYMPVPLPQHQLQLPAESYGYDFFSNPIRELDSTPPLPKPCDYSSGLQGLDSSSVQFPIFNNLGLAPVNSFSYEQCSSNTNSSLVEAQPYYYPSYVSSPIPPPVAPPNLCPSSSFSTLYGSSLGDHDNKPELGFNGHTSGFWNRSPQLNHGKGSSSSGSQGCQDAKDSLNGEASRMFDWEKASLPMAADQPEGKPCLWGSIKRTPLDFSSSSLLVSPSSSLETHPEGPLSYTGSNDKHLGQHDIPSRVDTKSSAPIKRLFMDLNVGNSIAEGDTGNKIFYSTKEAYHRPNPGTAAGCFGLGQSHMHLESYEPSSSNNAMISASDRNVSRDVVDYIFKEMHGFQDPDANPDNLSLRLSANEDVNSVEKSFDGADRCNPAVDSPCWKGAPAIHFSHYKTSEALPPEYVQKSDKFFGSVIQEPQNFVVDADNNVKKSCRKSVTYQVQDEISNHEMNLAGSPRKPSVAKFPSENCNFDGAVNSGPFQSEPSYVITETKENDIPSNKSICNSESWSSFVEHHAALKKQLMLQKRNTLCTDGADAGSNVNDRLECGVSHTEECALSSTSSVAYAPTTVGKYAGNVSTHKLNVQMLVDSMHNLSELLLSHCVNDACELKEQDRNVLKNVINNLNTCTLKNAAQLTCSQECLFPQTVNSRCARQSQEIQQSASVTKQQLTQVGPESSKVELENPLVLEAKNLYKEGLVWISGSIPPRGDAEMKKEDNMTKALKEILSENFHADDEGAESQNLLYKNLWLEAEAALCSISYKARYHKMKIEMEKNKQEDMEEQYNSQRSANKVHIDSSVPNATNVKELSDLKFSVDMNEPNASTAEGKSGNSGQDLDGLFQDSAVSATTNKEAGDDVASVLARFHVIKSRVDKSDLNTVNLEEPSDIAAAKFPPRESDSQNEDNFCEDSPTPCIIKADDYEASVMSRLQILKSRLEDSSSMPSDDKSLDGFDSEGTEDAMIITKALKGKSLDAYVNASSMHTGVDHEEIQPCGTDELANQLPTYDSVPDGLTFDWEHVERSL